MAHKDDAARDLTYAVCRNTDFWGEDLTALPGFAEAAAKVLEEIEVKGTYDVMKDCL